MLEEAGRLEEAYAAVQKAFEVDPAETARAFSMEGRVLSEAGHVRAARRSYRSALALDPLALGALGSLGYSYSVTGREGAAIRIYRQVIREDPTDAYYHREIDAALQRQRRRWAFIGGLLTLVSAILVHTVPFAGLIVLAVYAALVAWAYRGLWPTWRVYRVLDNDLPSVFASRWTLLTPVPLIVAAGIVPLPRAALITVLVVAGVFALPGLGFLVTDVQGAVERAERRLKFRPDRSLRGWWRFPPW